MSLTTFASTSMYESKKAFIVFAIVTIWCTLAILPMHIDDANENFRIVTTVLGVIPLPIVMYYIYMSFIYVAFNRDSQDDIRLSIIAFIFTLLAWVVAWSMIYIILWIWGHDNFKHFSTTNVYEAWGFLIAGSLFVIPGSAPYYTGDPTMVFSALICGLNAFFSILLLFAVFAVIIEIVRGLNKKSRHHKHESSHVVYGSSVSYSYPPSQQQEVPFNVLN